MIQPSDPSHGENANKRMLLLAAGIVLFVRSRAAAKASSDRDQAMQMLELDERAAV